MAIKPDFQADGHGITIRVDRDEWRWTTETLWPSRRPPLSVAVKIQAIRFCGVNPTYLPEVIRAWARRMGESLTDLEGSSLTLLLPKVSTEVANG